MRLAHKDENSYLKRSPDDSLIEKRSVPVTQNMKKRIKACSEKYDVNGAVREFFEQFLKARGF